ncbi:hypothetical protein A4W87_02095 [Latilactobacillus sakei]|uniref:EpsG family protein n=2 Tax=Latilactobacillus sakei TaxID=1599 RepID=UPI0009780132|nr:EpsG family protein [Latilactobacillus sakei]USG03725.1 hypothetical protein A4W87_02095 [Latilactobacillus sakei]
MIYLFMACICVFFGILADMVKARILDGNLEYASPASIFMAKRYYLILLIMAFIPLFYIGAIRYFVGIDYTTYTNYQIPHVLNGDTRVKVEYLYKQVIFLGNWISNGKSYQPIFVITQGIITLFLFLAVKNTSKDTGVSIWIFVCSSFYAFSLSGMRQAIGSVIFLYALKFIKNKNLKMYVLFLVIAVLFHSSALIYVAASLFLFFNLKIDYTMIALPIIYLASNIIFKIILFISNLTGLYSDYFTGVFNVIYFRPVQIFYILAVSLSIIVILKITEYQYDDKVMNFMLSIQSVLSIVCALVTIIPSSSRLIYGLLPIHILLIPNVLNRIENKELRFSIKIVVYLIYILLFYRCIIIGNYYETLPYKTIYSGINNFLN